MKILEAAYKWKKQKTSSNQDWKHFITFVVSVKGMNDEKYHMLLIVELSDNSFASYLHMKYKIICVLPVVVDTLSYMIGG